MPLKEPGLSKRTPPSMPHRESPHRSSPLNIGNAAPDLMTVASDAILRLSTVTTTRAHGLSSSTLLTVTKNRPTLVRHSTSVSPSSAGSVVVGKPFRWVIIGVLVLVGLVNSVSGQGYITNDGRLNINGSTIGPTIGIKLKRPIDDDLIGNFHINVLESGITCQKPSISVIMKFGQDCEFPVQRTGDATGVYYLIGPSKVPVDATMTLNVTTVKISGKFGPRAVSADSPCNTNTGWKPGNDHIDLKLISDDAATCGLYIQFDPNRVEEYVPTTTPSTTTTNPASTSTPITSDNNTTEPNGPPWLWIGVGCGAGALLILVIIISVVVWCCYCKKKKDDAAVKDEEKGGMGSLVTKVELPQKEEPAVEVEAPQTPASEDNVYQGNEPIKEHPPGPVVKEPDQQYENLIDLVKNGPPRFLNQDKPKPTEDQYENLTQLQKGTDHSEGSTRPKFNSHVALNNSEKPADGNVDLSDD